MARALRMDIDGLPEMLGALDRGQAELPDVLRTVLRGAGGQAILSEARSRVRSRTGRTVEHMGVHPLAHDGVSVGYDGEVEHVGTWLESGVKPHEINARGLAARHGMQLPGGHFATHVLHPGIRAQRIMSKSLRAAQWEVEGDIVDELNRRRWAQEGAG